MANEMLVTCRICGKEYTGRLDGLFYDGEDGNGPPVPLGASCPSCEPASPAAESECVCGGTTSRPNDDCERCQLLARIRELEGKIERLEVQLYAATFGGNPDTKELDELLHDYAVREGLV